MRRNLLGTILFSFLYILMLAAEAAAVLAVIRLDMLPIAYLVGIVLVLALFSCGIGMLLFYRGRYERKGKKILGCVLAVVLLCGSAAIATVAHDVVKTIEATSQEEPQIHTREIYVLTDCQAQELADTVGYTFGYVKNFDEAATRQVLEQLQTQVSGNYVTAGYTNLFAMANALLNEQIDAMILNGGYIDILDETEEFMGFSEKVRILTQFPVDEAAELEVPLQQQEQLPEEPQVTEATEPVATEPPQVETQDFTKLKPFLVYVSGSDSHTEMLSSGRSDVNILAAVNPMTKQILLINTPRDYYVSNTAGRGAKDKLTHCGLYGISCSMNTLGNLYEETVEYYVQVNFTGFKKLIDAMGGITVYSDYAFTAITRTDIKQGENHLTGQQALDFARERYTLRGGDNDRGKHQMQVIEAVIKKATSGTTILSNYSDIMASVEGMFTMNVPAELISSLMKMQLSDMAQWNIVTYSAAGNNAFAECYSLPGMELSVIEPSMNSVSKAVRLIDMVFSGELLTEELVNSIS